MGLRPGIRLGDRYQMLTPIAAGGMGQVWRAEDSTLHRVVAVKVLRSEFTGDPTFLERFRNEARNAAALSHPNIASVFDYGEAVHDNEKLAYLVMELVEGEPLVEILLREKRLTAPRTLDLIEQTGSGLDAAHRAGMVHRDVKPGNLMVRTDGVVKITDFGIARAASNVPLTDQGMVVGTAQYLAPEQAEGKQVTPASDVYALGVVGYECLAGRRPFDGDNSVAIALRQIRENPAPLPLDVPPMIRDLVIRAMSKDPRMRFANGGELAKAARLVRSGRPLPPLRRPQQGPPGPPGRMGGMSGPSGQTGPNAQVAASPGISGQSGVSPIVTGQSTRTGPPGRSTGQVPQMSHPPGGMPPGPGGPLPPGQVPSADPGANRRTALWVLLALLLAIVLAGIVYLIVDSGDGGVTGPNPDGQQQTVPAEQTGQGDRSGDPEHSLAPGGSVDDTDETIILESVNYEGRPRVDVEEDLEKLGLVVLIEADTFTDGLPPDTVTAVEPAGEPLHKGDQVIVYVSAPQVEPDFHVSTRPAD